MTSSKTKWYFTSFCFYRIFLLYRCNSQYFSETSENLKQKIETWCKRKTPLPQCPIINLNTWGHFCNKKLVSRAICKWLNAFTAKAFKNQYLSDKHVLLIRLWFILLCTYKTFKAFCMIVFRDIFIFQLICEVKSCSVWLVHYLKRFTDTVRHLCSLILSFHAFIISDNIYYTISNHSVRFNYGFDVFNICCDPRSVLMLDAKRRALRLTEGYNKRETPKTRGWMLLLYLLNLFLVIPSFAPLYKDIIVVSTVEINVCYTSLSWQTRAFLKSTGKNMKSAGKSCGFFAILHA